MELKKVKLQELNGSYFAYLPKIWIKNSGTKKGDIVVWSIDENNFENLQLKIERRNGNYGKNSS